MNLQKHNAHMLNLEIFDFIIFLIDLKRSNDSQGKMKLCFLFHEKGIARFVTSYVCVKVINSIDATHQNIRHIVWSIMRQYTQNRYKLGFIIVLTIDVM